MAWQHLERPLCPLDHCLISLLTQKVPVLVLNIIYLKQCFAVDINWQEAQVQRWTKDFGC